MWDIKQVIEWVNNLNNKIDDIKDIQRNLKDIEDMWISKVMMRVWDWFYSDRRLHRLDWTKGLDRIIWVIKEELKKEMDDRMLKL